MTRPITMPLQLYEQLAHGSIVRNRIRHRHDRLEPEQPLLVTVHHRPLIWPFSSGILYIVETFAVCLPDIDLDTFDGLALGIFDGAEDEAGFAVGVVCYLGTVWRDFCFVGVEGSEDCAFGACWWFWVIDAVDEKGKAEDVGEEDKFLQVV